MSAVFFVSVVCVNMRVCEWCVCVCVICLCGTVYEGCDVCLWCVCVLYIVCGGVCGMCEMCM